MYAPVYHTISTGRERKQTGPDTVRDTRHPDCWSRTLVLDLSYPAKRIAGNVPTRRVRPNLIVRIYSRAVLLSSKRTMAQSSTASNPLSKLRIASTLIDAAVAFARGRTGSGVLLLASAALSKRMPGLGVVVSVLLRLVRRLR